MLEGRSTGDLPPDGLNEPRIVSDAGGVETGARIGHGVGDDPPEGETTMTSESPVTRDTVDRLCVLANLPLAANRRDKLVPGLSALVAAANDLNRKMAEASRRSVLPITRFPDR